MRPITCKICNYKWHFKLAEEKEKWQTKMKCPSCLVDYCVLPETERKLRKIQNLYIENRDDRYFKDMFEILISYCKSLILKSFSNKITSPGLLDYYANNAVSFFIEEYKKKKNFMIEKSFGGYLKTKIKQAIFGKQEHASAPESLDWEFDDKKKVIHSVEHDILDEIEKNENKYLLWNYILKLIYGVSSHCSPLEYYILIINMESFLRNGYKYVDMFFADKEKGGFGREGKDIFLKTITMLQEELKRKQKENQSFY